MLNTSPSMLSVFHSFILPRYEKLHPKPSWALKESPSLHSSDFEFSNDKKRRHDDETEITCTNAELLHELSKLNMTQTASQTGASLPPIPDTLINMTKLSDVNHMSPSKASRFLFLSLSIPRTCGCKPV